MSQNQQPSSGLKRNQSGGSVKRARELLKAGVRMENLSEYQENRRMQPPPLRPRPTHPLEYDRPHSQEAEAEIGYRIENDPRGPVPIVPIQELSVPPHNDTLQTSRRGQSSVYSRLNVPAVSPIPEETPVKKKKKGSYASSMAIPSSWGSGPAVSEILDSYGSEQDELKRKRDSLVLLRQASLGKRGKPSLRTINKPQMEVPLSNESYNKSSDSSLGYSTVNGLECRPSLDSVSSSINSIDMEKEMMGVEKEQRTRKAGIGLGLGQAIGGMSSRKPNSHRPPQLDLNAVRVAEARGSLTSLPDLIRRATKVASNLDRGKTASRLGPLDMFDSGKEGKHPTHRSSASLSDILASFPPPRTSTPDDSLRNRSSWPFPPTNAAEKSRLRQMQTNSVDESGNGGRSGRRYCGMSLPLLIVVCVVVFLVVAAAVIIPVVLVVVPREKNHSTAAASTANTTTTCEKQLPCMNGGVSIQTGTGCSCVCVDGYSGSQCGDASDGSCTTVETSESNNATIGSSLPSLLSQSENDFNIPLNETDILSVLNTNNASCTVQNALVSFGGTSVKHRRQASHIEIRDPGTEPQITAVPIVKREEATATQTYVAPILSVPTDTTTASTAAETAGAASMATTGTTTSTASSASASASGVVEQVYEFAGVAVLYILEQTQDFDAAQTAQKDIDLYLLSQSVATSTNMNMSLSMPETFVLSFTNFTITLSNGTVVGGGNGTAT